MRFISIALTLALTLRFSLANPVVVHDRSASLAPPPVAQSTSTLDERDIRTYWRMVETYRSLSRRTAWKVWSISCGGAGAVRRAFTPQSSLELANEFWNDIDTTALANPTETTQWKEVWDELGNKWRIGVSWMTVNNENVQNFLHSDQYKTDIENGLGAAQVFLQRNMVEFLTGDSFVWMWAFAPPDPTNENQPPTADSIIAKMAIRIVQLVAGQ